MRGRDEGAADRDLGRGNFGIVDPYTLVHGLVGVVAAAVGLRFFGVLTLAIGWEIAEHVLKQHRPLDLPPRHAGHLPELLRRRAGDDARVAALAPPSCTGGSTARFTTTRTPSFS